MANKRLYYFKPLINEREEKEMMAKSSPEKQHEIIMFLKTFNYYTSHFGFSIAEMSDTQLSKFNELSLDAKIFNEITDISNDAFNGAIHSFILQDEIIVETIINPFLLNNMPIDVILDKILKEGINSLRPIEMQILNNKKYA